MNFFHRNIKKINIWLVISIISDVALGFLTNIMSQEGFDIFAPHNMVFGVILVVLVLTLIVCRIIETKAAPHVQRRKLQKAFQENGGYEAVVDEMKTCIKQHDFESMRNLKKFVDMLEK